MFTGTDNQQASNESPFARLLGMKQPILITSNYKGIVLTQPVDVLNAGPERVTIQAPDLNVCFSVKEQVQLYSQSLQEIILARLLAVNTIVGELELTDLSFPGYYWKDRQSDRVQPHDPIYVHGQYQQATMRACLNDISVEGISLMVYQCKTKPVVFDRNALVRLAMQLPDDDARGTLRSNHRLRRSTGRDEPGSAQHRADR